MDKSTLIANGCLGLSAIGLVGVFRKEVVELLRKMTRKVNLVGDFNQNRG